MKHAILVATALTIIAHTASAAPPPCTRWKNKLSDCEALGLPQGCTHTPAGAELEQLNHKQYAGTAEKACRQLIKNLNPQPGSAYYTPGEAIRACTFAAGDNTCHPIIQVLNDPPTSDFACCVYDANNDAKIDYNDVALVGNHLVEYLPTTPDSHCSCTAKGPYDGLEWNSDGLSEWTKFMAFIRHAFPSGLRKAVLRRNQELNGLPVGSTKYLSDGHQEHESDRVLRFEIRATEG